MKKLVMVAVVLILGAMTAIPALALESVFNGSLRVRFFTNQNFDGNDDDGIVNIGTAGAPVWRRTSLTDWSGVDMRTRLSYTAIINENLKFVNTFEIDAVWGNTAGQANASTGPWGAGGYRADGDFGTDGVGVEVKNSYAEFMLPWAPIFGKVGLQPIVLGRGFLFDDDFAGAVIGFKSDVVTVPLIWMKAYEGGLGYNNRDVDWYGIAPSITPNENVTITPYAVWVRSSDARDWVTYHGLLNYDDLNMYFVGLDVDATVGPANIWLTGIYQGGDGDIVGTNLSDDFKAWLAAAGVKIDFAGKADFHGQVFYATGDDNTSDQDQKAFLVPSGQSYYWAEIMGLGIFDNDFSRNAPGDWISNILAGNLGFTIKPVDGLSVTFDAWYARLVEDIQITATEKDNYLGTELDLKVSYELVKNLNLDVVGAYLFAGDATTLKAANDANPWEAGAQLSLSY